MIWEPDISLLEIDITYACGFGCANCNRMTVVAPGTRETNFTVSQMEKLIEQSVELNWPWRKWCLIGGEPTTHPDFWLLLRKASEYRAKHNPALLLQVTTHGFGRRTEAIICAIRDSFSHVRIRNTEKKSRIQPDFVSINVAPQDVVRLSPSESVYNGCWIPEECGIGLNYAGFYCCGVAGAIDRICGNNLAVRNLSEVSADRLRTQYPLSCSMCGHYRPAPRTIQHPISNSWALALARYRDTPPRLEHY